MELDYVLARLEKLDEKLDQILVQTTKTNGRVLSLESWRKYLDKIMWWALGVFVAIGVMLLEKFFSK